MLKHSFGINLLPCQEKNTVN